MNKGFTLLEVIVSVSIVAVVGVAITQAFFSTTTSGSKSQALQEIKQNGDYALSIMERMIHNAVRVTNTCDANGELTPALSIQNLDGGTTTFGCQAFESYTRIASSSGSAVVYLTDKGISLGAATCDTNTLTFTCTRDPGGATKVAIFFKLQTTGVGTAIQSTLPEFATTVTLRN